MPLNEQTRESIGQYLLKEVSRFIEENRASAQERPFHIRLLPVLSEVRFSERSFSTRSGSWFQQIAKLVGQQFNAQAKLNHLVSGRIQAAAESHITAITEQMDHGRPRRKPDRVRDISEVLTVQSTGGVDREVRSDLFLQRHDGRELYFEMKTPAPNKGQCLKMKHDILVISALRHEAEAEAYAAAAYNPFGDGKPYTHNYAMQFLEIGKDILIGREFWAKIGDDRTYDDLLSISESVGKRLLPLIEHTRR